MGWLDMRFWGCVIDEWDGVGVVYRFCLGFELVLWFGEGNVMEMFVVVVMGIIEYLFG